MNQSKKDEALSSPTSTDNNDKEGNARKKINRDDISNSSEQVKVEAVKEVQSKASINDLPTEMLVEILKRADTRSLLKSRLVNRQWNVISTKILPERSALVCFDFNFNHTANSALWGSKENPNNLKEFLKFVKKSKNCFYNHFAFCEIQACYLSKFFHNEDWIKFLVDFAGSNPRIKGLKFQITTLQTVDACENLTENLRDVLLNKIPRLEEFGLEFLRSDDWPEVELFPEQADKSTPIKMELPHLKSIRFESNLISTHTQIVKDLLNAAVNLNQIYAEIKKFEDFAFLHSLGKLDLLKDVSINIDETFFSSTENENENEERLTTLPQEIKLNTLELYLTMREDDQTTCASASSFITSLFESNKNRLMDLSVKSMSCGFGCLPNFQLPTFTNLRSFGLSVDFDTKSQIFPPGSRTRNIFPNVISFDLDMKFWSDGAPTEDTIPILPRVETLSILGINCREDVFSTLAVMLPNLVKLKIHKSHDINRVTIIDEWDLPLFRTNSNWVKKVNNDDGNETSMTRDKSRLYRTPSLNFAAVGRFIWTHMKQLESLEVDVHVGIVENHHHVLDSCFTGFSLEKCQRLYELRQAQRKEQMRGGKSQAKIQETESESKSELTKEREHASILDMQDLKELKVNPYSRKSSWEKKEFFTHNLTWISQEYAFKLMPQLKLNQETF